MRFFFQNTLLDYFSKKMPVTFHNVGAGPRACPVFRSQKRADTGARPYIWRVLFLISTLNLCLFIGACGLSQKELLLNQVKKLKAVNGKLADENRDLKTKMKNLSKMTIENKAFKKFLSENMPVLLAFQKSKKDFASITRYFKNPNPEISYPALKFYLSLKDIKTTDKIKVLEHLALSPVPDISESAFYFVSKTLKSQALRLAVIKKLSGPESAYSQALIISKFWQDSQMQAAVLRVLGLNSFPPTQVELASQRKARFVAIKNCLEALGYFRNEKSLNAIKPYLLDITSYKPLIPTALNAIKRIDLPNLNAPLIALAIDKKTEAAVRSSAVSVLYSINANKFKPKNPKESKTLIRDLFISLLGTKSKAIRLQVIVGMGKLLYPSFKKPLLGLLKLSGNALEQEYLAASLVKIDGFFAAKEFIALGKLDKYYGPLRDFASESSENDVGLFALAYTQKKYAFCLKLWEDKHPELLSHRKKASIFKSLNFKQGLLLVYWAQGKVKEGRLRLGEIIPAIVKAKEPQRLYDIATILFALGRTKAVLKTIDPIVKNIPLKSNLLYFQARHLKIQCALLAKDKKTKAIQSEIKVLLKQIPARDVTFKKVRKLLIEIQKKLNTPAPKPVPKPEIKPKKKTTTPEK